MALREINTPDGGETIVVAMSGGVDSSVAAAMIRQQGYNVIGVTLRMLAREDDEGSSSARAVAEKLGIAHHLVDCTDAFLEHVLRPCWEAYAHGRTPNPCSWCNPQIKWHLLLEHARGLGAKGIATGHYARVFSMNEMPTLWRACDHAKDQAYFLFALQPEQLAVTHFPLGGMKKTEVRDIAMALDLPNAQAADSQDACFVGQETGFAETLRNYLGGVSRPGVFIDETGRVVGQHDGVHHFTIGQRRGLGVALGDRAYVVAIDPDKAVVVVSTDETQLRAHGLIARDIHWQACVDPSIRHVCEIQTRYRQIPVEACVTPLEPEAGISRAKVVFARPIKAVTPGQAVVFFGGDRVLGGGWIDHAL